MIDRTLTFQGRLPGVVCEAALSPSTENPLRLNVAAFVGFAERGPLDLPIALEDISQYQAVFGSDLLLARTRQGGQPVYANLPRAVRAFFDNGGRRCYVVRVAQTTPDVTMPTNIARPNRFRIPGMLAWGKDTQDVLTLKTVVAPAAWVGRWSDSMSIGTQLLSQPLRLSRIASPAIPLGWRIETEPAKLDETDEQIQKRESTVKLYLELPTALTLFPGDSLRLHIDTPDKHILFCAVNDVRPARTTDLHQFSETQAASLIRLHSVLTIVTATIVQACDVTDASTPLAQPFQLEVLTQEGWQELPLLVPQQIQAQQQQGGTLYSLSVSAADGEIQAGVGDVLRVTCVDGRVLLFPIADVTQHNGRQDVSSGDTGTFILVSQNAFWQAPFPTFEAYPTLAAYGNVQELDLLSFDLYVRENEVIMEHWSDLRMGISANSGNSQSSANYWIDYLVPTPDALLAEMTSGTQQRQVPGLDSTRSARLGCVEHYQTETVYLPLFMGDLPGTDEFAVPLPDPFEVADPSCPIPSKDGLEVFEAQQLFLDERLVDVGVRDLLNEANALLYFNPDNESIALTKLHSLLMIDEIGMIALPDLAQRAWTYNQPMPEPPPAGGESQPIPPDWSHFQDCCAIPENLPVDVPKDKPGNLSLLPILEEPSEYQPSELDSLLAVHHALVNLCAARANVIAVLSLPLHFLQREVLDWQRQFTGIPDFFDGPTLSYAVMYHPWLHVPEEVTPQLAPLRSIPPDGTVCGMIATRELQRGAWIAPANTPLLGVVGLTPALTIDDWTALFNAQINVVRQQPGQFTLMSAHTLSNDDTLLQVSVRRLLIFLRKLALRRGMRYVFEANNARFRRRVQASFERTLTQMMALGAVSAFQVVTDSSINTQNDYDNGRFLIALKVAPTIPIEFITVVLLRAGEDLLQVIEQ